MLSRSLYSLFLLAHYVWCLNTTTISSNLTALSKSFDYVIVGGGLTGLVAGNKLSASGATVLIIEAGPDLQHFDPINDVYKAGLLSTTYAGVCDWNYPLSGQGLEGRNLTTSAGRCLGGSTSINGMVWFQPEKAELDALGSMGNPGWSWDTLSPVMRDAEKFHSPTTQQLADGANYDAIIHGTDGAVDASFLTPLRSPDAQAVYKAAMPLVFPGLSVSDDMSSEKPGSKLASTAYSIQYLPETNFTLRSSAANSYLYPSNQQRPTLFVLTSHLATRIITAGNNSNIKATGVEVAATDKSGGRIVIDAGKEVILAAGTLGSAPLLERSGIGSKKILKAHNISQVVDLPGVGLNLHDQPGSTVTATIKPENASNPRLVDIRTQPFAPVIALVTLSEVFPNSSAEIGAQLKANVSARAKQAVEDGVMATFTGAVEVFETLTNLIVDHNIPIAEIVGETYPGVFSVIIWPSVPFSRGTVHISSSDPFEYPTTVPRYLSDLFDVQVSVEIAKAARKMMQTPPFQPLVLDAFADPANVTSDAEWETWFKATSFGASHLVGATAMLPREKGGVVDERLRVYGVKGLRVIDAGILPIEITSHTSSALYATSAYAAQMILEDHK